MEESEPMTRNLGQFSIIMHESWSQSLRLSPTRVSALITSITKQSGRNFEIGKTILISYQIETMCYLHANRRNGIAVQVE